MDQKITISELQARELELQQAIGAAQRRTVDGDPAAASELAQLRADRQLVEDQIAGLKICEREKREGEAAKAKATALKKAREAGEAALSRIDEREAIVEELDDTLCRAAKLARRLNACDQQIMLDARASLPPHLNHVESSRLYEAVASEFGMRGFRPTSQLVTARIFELGLVTGLDIDHFDVVKPLANHSFASWLTSRTATIRGWFKELLSNFDEDQAA